MAPSCTFLAVLLLCCAGQVSAQSFADAPPPPLRTAIFVLNATLIILLVIPLGFLLKIFREHPKARAWTSSYSMLACCVLVMMTAFALAATGALEQEVRSTPSNLDISGEFFLSFYEVPLYAVIMLVLHEQRASLPTKPGASSKHSKGEDFRRILVMGLLFQMSAILIAIAAIGRTEKDPASRTQMAKILGGYYFMCDVTIAVLMFFSSHSLVMQAEQCEYPKLQVLKTLRTAVAGILILRVYFYAIDLLLISNLPLETLQVVVLKIILFDCPAAIVTFILVRIGLALKDSSTYNGDQVSV